MQYYTTKINRVMFSKRFMSLLTNTKCCVSHSPFSCFCRFPRLLKRIQTIKLSLYIIHEQAKAA